MLVVSEQVTDWVNLVRAEYLEMPGLCLTKPQMQRLWLLDAPLCDAIVEMLVSTGFLRRKGNNYFRYDTEI